MKAMPNKTTNSKPKLRKPNDDELLLGALLMTEEWGCELEPDDDDEYDDL